MKILCLICLFSWLGGLPYPADLILYSEGTVAYYEDPNLMRRVWKFRKSWGQDLGDLDDFIDGIALNDCSYLGKTAFIVVNDVLLIGPLLVVDCACAEHLPGRIDKGLIADLGYYTAVELLGARTYIEDITIYLEKGTDARVWK